MFSNSLIIPSYIKHFSYVNRLLASAEKYLLDKDLTEFIFIINRDELSFFIPIVNNYKDVLNIRILCFEDVLIYYGIQENPDFLLDKYGRFTFQTLKKFYAMLYLDRKNYLVIDSESLFIAPTSISALKDLFFKKPFLLISNIKEEKRNLPFMTFCHNIEYILDYEVNQWPLEHYVWFYDIAILKDLVKTYGDFYLMADKLYHRTLSPYSKISRLNREIKYGIFEIILYLTFIKKNNALYGYNIISVDSLLNEYLGHDTTNKYYSAFYSKFNGNCGVLEHAMLLLTKENCKGLATLFRDANLNIIRCDKTNYKNFTLQRKFLKIVKPRILASSQDHCFGNNFPTRKIIKMRLKKLFTK